MPPAIPQTPPQPTDLLMYVTILIIFLLMSAVALLAFLIYDKFIYPRRQKAKKLERIRNEMLDREEAALVRRAEEKARKEWSQNLLRQFKEDEARRSEEYERDSTLIIPFANKEYWNGLR